MPAERIAALSEDERRARKEEKRHGCALVDRWETYQRDPLPVREGVCRACPRGKLDGWPLATPLYAKVVRYLAEHEAGLASGRDAYTQREIDAIVFVKGEFSAAYRDKGRRRREAAAAK